MQNFKNVHEYDGTLGNLYTPVVSFTTEQKISLFTEFMKKVSSTESQIMISIIIKDLRTRTVGNMDLINNIDCSDVLADICHKLSVKKDIELGFIEEQIVDIANLGRCAQGRTTRFIQIWNAIKDL